MEKIKLGLIKETKNPPDKRVPLSPQQCVEVEKRFPNVEVYVESSDIRAFSDDDYRSVGVKVVESVAHCDILMGVKEVKLDALVPNKTYFFFSHTFKEQPYNAKLLKTILEKQIQLVDYEVLTDANEKRIIGFGRYAGIVGCYNGFRALGLKHGWYTIKPANECFDRKELNNELKKVKLPSNTKIVATGFGRVGNGAREIFKALNLQEVEPNDFLNNDFDAPVFTQLRVKHYFDTNDGRPFSSSAFMQNGEGHISTFKRYLKVADLYVACHYWDSTSPFIISRDDLKENIRTKVIADVSCDIDGPIGCTLRPSTIASPLYGYHPILEKEVDFNDPEAIAVMAVDNLPCELPKDASEDFGNELIESVFPYLFGEDPDRIIERASETNLNGELMPDYNYLQNYVNSVS